MPSCLGLGRMRLAWVLMAMTVGVGGDLHLHAIQKGPTSCTSALEPLMQQHSAEKSKSGHKYTDLYAALFDAVRDGVANVTVLGATGPQLRQAWQAYFCNAAVHVVDPEKVLEPDAAAPPATADVVFDGMSGAPQAQREASLQLWWPSVRKGAYYVLEGLDKARGGLNFQQAPEALQPGTRALLEGNEAFFVDPSVGHRQWAQWVRQQHKSAEDGYAAQASYVLVLRKRRARPHRVQTFFGSGFDYAAPYKHMSPGGPAEGLACTAGLEALMYRSGTDKSRDDHKYSDLYAALLDPLRHRVGNVTELGIARGASLTPWSDFFCGAAVHGVDITITRTARRIADLYPRVHLHHMDSTVMANVVKAGFQEGTMDVIVDDVGAHTAVLQQALLHVWWPYLRPGGLYFMEDVDAQRGGLDWTERPEAFEPRTRALLQDNDAFLVDTAVGHRNWPVWLERVTPEWARDHRQHNSYNLVIRKRQ